MMALVVILRLLHVVLGALWLGTMVFLTLFLVPSLQEAGPPGGKVMEALQRRGMMTAIPIFALGAMLSGFGLFWIVSGGLSGAFMKSHMGIALGIGVVFAMASWFTGVTVMRPAMLGAAASGQALAGATTDEERARLQGEATRFRARAGAAGRAVTVLLIIAACAMAVARYV